MAKRTKLEQDVALDKAFDILIESGADLSKILEPDGLLKQMTKRLVEKALKAEMNKYLGYEKNERQSQITATNSTDESTQTEPISNSRNGYSSKSIVTDNGTLELAIPRDRRSEFDPILVPKRSTRIKGLDDKIISLYAKGMSISDIKIQLEELYAGAEISESLISSITAEVMAEVIDWQNRQLDSVYPITFIDCLVVKVKQDGRVINKSVYIVLGVSKDGIKEVLGLWIDETESAKFWLNVLTGLKIEDYMIF